MPPISTLRRRILNEVVPAFGSTYPEIARETHVKARHQSYVESPEYLPIQWINACGGLDAPLAEFPETFRPLIIGAGWAGTRMALEFAKSGIKASIIEALKHCGGRTTSVQGHGKNEYHLGSMRYPPSEGMLFEWAYHFGFAMLAGFVDPGVYPTLLAFSDLVEYWDDPKKIPQGFETVFKGWNAMLEEGFEIDGKKFASFVQINKLLRSEDVKTRGEARPLWQTYIDHFKNWTLQEIMLAIFVDNTKPPGGVRWTLDDLEVKWSKGGIGSGGFGIFFRICALTIMRFPPNEWEVDQCVFAEKVGGEWTATTVQKLVAAMLKKAHDLVGLEVQYETELVDIRKSNGVSGNPVYIVTVQNSSGSHDIECDLPILAIPPSIIVALRLAREDIFPAHVCTALKNVHMVETTKVFVSIPRCHFEDPAEVRVVLGDLFQSYILDFKDPTYMAGLLDYAWAEHSVRYHHETDAKKCVEIVKADITKALMGSKYAYWLSYLDEIEDAFVIHWEDFKYARGAFSFPKPGQDKHCSVLFHYSGEDGPCVTTASATPYDGWIEGAEIKAQHDFAHIADRYGKVKHKELSPVALMKPFEYGDE